MIGLQRSVNKYLIFRNRIEVNIIRHILGFCGILIWKMIKKW
jgi:hypothetical protein